MQQVYCIYHHHVEIAMRLICIILLFLLACNVYSDTLENIQQQFGIYQRYSGEIELLSSDNVQEIDNVLKRTATKRINARRELDNISDRKQAAKNLTSLLDAERYAVPFAYYVAVERTFAIRSLQQEKPDDAMKAIQYVYRLADVLSNTECLKLRTAAAIIRVQTLDTVQSFLQNPLCRHEHHEILYTLFEKHLNREENDRMVWTRYKEEGKRFFDTAQNSGLDKIVPQNIWKELRNRQVLASYENTTKERFAHDEKVFQDMISLMIESCLLPYYQRHGVIRQLDAELQKRQGTSTEPVFAILLLRDVRESMRLLAQEQSGMEMAYLALAAALKGQTRRKTMNFLTGKEYEFHLITNGIMCTYEGNIKPFYVPYR